jgi:FlaA1/EpsC-like NDP-sugar epimerase
MLEGKKILMFGGSGSLGNAIIERYLGKNTLINYSRDEAKHWAMELKYNSPNLQFIIGDIRDKEHVETSILRTQPNIIIIAAALKHVDRCEYAVHECHLTNFMGPKNVVDSIEKNQYALKGLEAVVFISTDKACEPTNVYGMCKALSETLMVEKSLNVPSIKFLTVRYGNVLNSRGSIIPLLHEIGSNPEKTGFTLTHDEMTRFVMTLDQSVDLIQHAIEHGENGDIVIPKLISMKVKDLIEIFSEKYNKPILKKKIRAGEKILESLISETQSYRLVKNEYEYYFIKPPYKETVSKEPILNYNSKLNPISKTELYSYLNERGLL